MDAFAPAEIVTVDPVPTAVVKGAVAMADLTSFFDTAFQRLAGVLADQGRQPTTPAFGLYHGVPGETVDIEVGFGTDDRVETDGDVVASELPGGRVARMVHAGSFDTLGDSWRALGAWMEEQGLAPGETLWEVYVTEPDPDMDPADLRTELSWSLRDAP